MEIQSKMPCHGMVQLGIIMACRALDKIGVFWVFDEIDRLLQKFNTIIKIKLFKKWGIFCLLYAGDIVLLADDTQFKSTAKIELILRMVSLVAV